MSDTNIEQEELLALASLFYCMDCGHTKQHCSCTCKQCGGYKQKCDCAEGIQ